MGEPTRPIPSDAHLCPSCKLRPAISSARGPCGSCEWTWRDRATSIIREFRDLGKGE